MIRIAVLASGHGSNLEALIGSVHGQEAEIVCVAGDRPAARALTLAAGSGIPAQAFPRDAFPDRDARDGAMAAWLSAHGAEVVVAAGYMAILGAGFVAAFRDRIINVHPSLLPAFPGLDAVGQAVAYGVRVFGVTVHLVDDGVDTGPILLQDSIRLDGAPTAEEALAALRPLEHRLLPEAVRLLAAGRVGRDPDNPRRLLIAGGDGAPRR